MNATPKPLDHSALPPEGTLMRTVMLMLALADLAEQAAGVSRAIRSYVLWVLRPVEALAWNYAFGSGEHDVDELTDYDLTAMRIGGSASQDALDLADSFRAIAAALQQVMIQYTLIRSVFGGDGWEKGSPVDYGKPYGETAVGQMPAHPRASAADGLPHPPLAGLSAHRPSRLAAVMLAAHGLTAAARAPPGPPVDRR